MYLNYALRMNGFEIINGYSDLMTPFLFAAGASAGATGWWSNLKTFSLERFSSGPGGGRLPTQRYLSISFLNRITFSELNILRTFMPNILNGLPTDSFYNAEFGSEPQRNKEVLQSWETIKRLIDSLGNRDVEEKLASSKQMVKNATNTYQTAQRYIQFDAKSNSEHLGALQEGINLFEQIAELRFAAE